MDLMDYRRKIIANSPHLMSASGAVATFSDGADLPLKSLNVDIEPVQSGTGDPSPVNFRPISGWNAVNVKNGNTVIATISLGQTVYGGTLNPLTGVLTVDRLGVPMESLTWYRSTSYANPIFYTTITGKASDYRKAACSILRNIGSGTIIAAKGFATQSANGDFASSDANAQIYARYDSATTVQEFVTAVTGQTIVYPLATPVTIQLTPHQIRSLYGNNTIFADTGNVALEYWAHP